MNALEVAQRKPTEAGLRSGRRPCGISPMVGHKDRDETKISCPSTLRPFIVASANIQKSEFRGGLTCAKL
jgi:hypothetical protein